MGSWGYIRASDYTPSQAEQQAALDEAGCDRVLVDAGSDRSRRGLPARRTLLDQLGAGDMIIVYRLDCLATSGRDLLMTIGAIFAKGAEFRSVRDEIDTSGGSGSAARRTLLALIGAQHLLTRETSRSAVARARDEGRRPGRSTLLDASHWPAIRQAFENGNIGELPDQFGVSRATLYNFRKRMLEQERISAVKDNAA